MNLPDWHKHVSERQTGAWIDCTWDSGVEFVRLTHDKAIPATHAEGDALRKASGDTVGGSSIGDLRRGIAARYHYAAPGPINTFNGLWSSLKPGTAAVVQGSMKAFGSTHRLSRFDPLFDGGHSVSVQRLDATDRVWWCDPEAPAGTYKGEWVTKDELLRFVTEFGGQHIVAPILAPPPPVTPPPTVTDMPALTAYTPGSAITIKATANIRKDPSNNATPLRTLTAPETWAIIGTVKGEALAGTDVWYVRWAGDHYEYVNRNGVASPPVAPVKQADLDAAKAALAASQASLTAANAKIAKAKADLA